MKNFVSILILHGLTLLSLQVKASYFKQSYQECREQFLRLAQKVPGYDLKNITIPSETDKELITDLAYFPVANAKKLVIINSGMHGIEGFVGSAMQAQFIENYLLNPSGVAKKKERSFSVLMIHSMNPYGFKNLRRVDEDNVDLNRNFDVTADLFNQKNAAYTEVYNLLNPKDKVELSWLTNIKFLSVAIYNIIKYSMESIRRSVLMGQYEHEKGLYFGGQEFRPQKKLLEPILTEEIKKYEQVLLIDIHTGYGERNHLHLFGEVGPEMNNDFLNMIFLGTPIDYGDKKKFYEVKGGFTRYVANLTHKIDARIKYAGVAFEFGTLNSQTLRGSLDSIHRMILENQGHHFGFADADTQETVRSEFIEMFYPTDSEWRNQAIQHFDEHLQSIYVNF